MLGVKRFTKGKPQFYIALTADGRCFTSAPCQETIGQLRKLGLTFDTAQEFVGTL